MLHPPFFLPTLMFSRLFLKRNQPNSKKKKKKQTVLVCFQTVKHTPLWDSDESPFCSIIHCRTSVIPVLYFDWEIDSMLLQIPTEKYNLTTCIRNTEYLQL